MMMMMMMASIGLMVLKQAMIWRYCVIVVLCWWKCSNDRETDWYCIINEIWLMKYCGWLIIVQWSTCQWLFDIDQCVYVMTTHSDDVIIVKCIVYWSIIIHYYYYYEAIFYSVFNGWLLCMLAKLYCQCSTIYSVLTAYSIFIVRKAYWYCNVYCLGQPFGCGSRLALLSSVKSWLKKPVLFNIISPEKKAIPLCREEADSSVNTVCVAGVLYRSWLIRHSLLTGIRNAASRWN